MTLKYLFRFFAFLSEEDGMRRKYCSGMCQDVSHYPSLPPSLPLTRMSCL
jgi:hypothetical protein